MRGRRRRAIVPPLAVALLAAALYAPTLRYPMQWDDRMMLVDSASFASIDSATELLTTPYRVFFSARNDGQPYYRPVNLTLLFLERSVFGVVPFGYRVVHAGLHVLCCLLIYALLLGLLARTQPAPWPSPEVGEGEEDDAASRWRRRLAAAFGAGLFAVAPYGVDTVLFLTSVGDQLVLLFSLVALLAGGAFLEGRGALSLALLALSSVLCVFSKENGAVLPVLFALYAFATGAKLRSGRFAAALGVTVASVVMMLVVRMSILTGSPPINDAGALGRALEGLWIAARFAVAPHPLGMEVTVPDSGDSPLEVVAGAVALAGFAIAVWVFRRRRAFFFGLIWWITAFAPSALTIAFGGPLAVRYLYISAVGAAGISAAACVRQRRPAFIATGGIVATWMVFAALRVFAWSDSFRLWSRESELNPDSASTLIQHGVAVWDKGNEEKAGNILKRAAAVAKEKELPALESLARSDLCLVLIEQRRLDDAMRECTAAIEAKPDSRRAWTALGDLHATDGDWFKALLAYQKSDDLELGQYDVLLKAAAAAAAIGDKELSLEYLERAATDSQGAPEKAAEVERRRRAAGESSKRPIIADEKRSDAWISLGNVRAARGEWAQALRAYQKAQVLHPSAVRSLISIAGAAAATGNEALALRSLDEAQKMSGRDVDTIEEFKRRRLLLRKKIEEVRRRTE